MIAIDWGTTNFRAYRVDAEGRIVGRRVDARGILAVPSGGFAALLAEILRPWLEEGERRVLMAGMVGSRQGWSEVPYLPCPAALDDLARQTQVLPPLSQWPDCECRIVPGLICGDEFGIPDVMRGEETQIMGLSDIGDGRILACLPGTHSKWAEVEIGRVVAFRTFMTGELYAVLREHSILGRSMTGEKFDEDAFDRGVSLALAEHPGLASASLMHRLFSTRTLVLTGELSGDEAPSYLSGMLIGEEVSAMRGRFGQENAVEVVGANHLVPLYERALGAAGVLPIIRKPDIVVDGLFAIGRNVSWRV